MISLQRIDISNKLDILTAKALIDIELANDMSTNSIAQVIYERVLFDSGKSSTSKGFKDIDLDDFLRGKTYAKYIDSLKLKYNYYNYFNIFQLYLCGLVKSYCERNKITNIDTYIKYVRSVITKAKTNFLKLNTGETVLTLALNTQYGYNSIKATLRHNYNCSDDNAVGAHYNAFRVFLLETKNSHIVNNYTFYDIYGLLVKVFKINYMYKNSKANYYLQNKAQLSGTIYTKTSNGQIDNASVYRLKDKKSIDSITDQSLTLLFKECYEFDSKIFVKNTSSDDYLDKKLYYSILEFIATIYISNYLYSIGYNFEPSLYSESFEDTILFNNRDNITSDNTDISKRFNLCIKQLKIIYNDIYLKSDRIIDTNTINSLCGISYYRGRLADIMPICAPDKGIRHYVYKHDTKSNVISNTVNDSVIRNTITNDAAIINNIANNQIVKELVIDNNASFILTGSGYKQLLHILDLINRIVDLADYLLERNIQLVELLPAYYNCRTCTLKSALDNKNITIANIDFNMIRYSLFEDSYILKTYYKTQYIEYPFIYNWELPPLFDVINNQSTKNSGILISNKNLARVNPDTYYMYYEACFSIIMLTLFNKTFNYNTTFYKFMQTVKVPYRKLGTDINGTDYETLFNLIGAKKIELTADEHADEDLSYDNITNFFNDDSLNEIFDMINDNSKQKELTYNNYDIDIQKEVLISNNYKNVYFIFMLVCIAANEFNNYCTNDFNLSYAGLSKGIKKTINPQNKNNMLKDYFNNIPRIFNFFRDAKNNFIINKLTRILNLSGCALNINSIVGGTDIYNKIGPTVLMGKSVSEIFNTLFSLSKNICVINSTQYFTNILCFSSIDKLFIAGMVFDIVAHDGLLIARYNAKESVRDTYFGASISLEKDMQIPYKGVNGSIYCSDYPLSDTDMFKDFITQCSKDDCNCPFASFDYLKCFEENVKLLALEIVKVMSKEDDFNYLKNIPIEKIHIIMFSLTSLWELTKSIFCDLDSQKYYLLYDNVNNEYVRKMQYRYDNYTKDIKPQFEETPFSKGNYYTQYTMPHNNENTTDNECDYFSVYTNSPNYLFDLDDNNNFVWRTNITFIALNTDQYKSVDEVLLDIYLSDKESEKYGNLLSEVSTSNDTLFNIINRLKALKYSTSKFLSLNEIIQNTPIDEYINEKYMELYNVYKDSKKHKNIIKLNSINYLVIVNQPIYEYAGMWNMSKKLIESYDTIHRSEYVLSHIESITRQVPEYGDYLAKIAISKLFSNMPEISFNYHLLNGIMLELFNSVPSIYAVDRYDNLNAIYNDKFKIHTKHLYKFDKPETANIMPILYVHSNENSYSNEETYIAIKRYIILFSKFAVCHGNDLLEQSSIDTLLTSIKTLYDKQLYKTQYAFSGAVYDNDSDIQIIKIYNEVKQSIITFISKSDVLNDVSINIITQSSFMKTLSTEGFYKMGDFDIDPDTKVMLHKNSNVPYYKYYNNRIFFLCSMSYWYSVSDSDYNDITIVPYYDA